MNLDYFQSLQKALAAAGAPCDKFILSRNENGGRFMIDPRFGASTSLWDASAFKEGNYGNVPVEGCLVIKKHSPTAWEYRTVDVIPPSEWYHPDPAQAAENCLCALLKKGYALKTKTKPLKMAVKTIPPEFVEYETAFRKMQSLKKEAEVRKTEFCAGDTAKAFVESLVVAYDPRLASKQTWENKSTLSVESVKSCADTIVLIVSCPLLGQKLRLSLRQADLTPQGVSQKLWEATKKKMKVV